MAGAATREHWGTRFGVILAVTGSAVGLGNFIRFPGLAAKYEGGTFMIPYFLALLLLGLPLAWMEWAMGRYGGRRGFNSPVGIHRAIWGSRLAPYLGTLCSVVSVIIYMYYLHVEAWCLAFAWKYATGAMDDLVAAGGLTAGFSGFVGMGGDGAQFADPLSTALPFVVIAFVCNFALIFRGVSRGIEWFSRLAMPALIVCAVIVLARVLTLPANPEHPEQSVLAGLGYTWNLPPTLGELMGELANGEMWLAATGQVFFTLSVGFGLILTYASYVREDDDIALSALTSAAGNEFCEVALGGMITIPAAFVFLGAAGIAAAGSTLGLGFLTLPNVFLAMPGGNFFGFVFFFLLFLAAITSSLSMLQPSIALLEEGLGLGRRASVTVLGFVTAVGCLFVAWFSEGLVVLDTIDFWVGNFALFMLALAQVLVFGWVLGVERGKAELDRGAEIRVPGFVMYLLKYVAPVYLLVVLGMFVWFEALKEGENRVAALAEPRVALALGFVGLVVAFFAMLTAQAVRRWREAERLAEEVSV